MDMPTRNVADQLVNSLKATIRGLEIYRASLINRPTFRKLDRLTTEMQAWAEANSTLQFHLGDNLRDLKATLLAFGRDDADLIDLQISQSNLTERLRVCIQAFSIQMEMVRPVTEQECCQA